jgi:hypothetical protein
MAVKGKKLYRLYLDQENYELVQSYLDTRKHAGGMSGLMDKHLTRCADVIRKNPELSEIEPGKLTLKKFWKLAKLNV